MKEEPKKYTEDELAVACHKAYEEAERRHYYVLEYLLNKNSHSILDGGLDLEKMFDELQDYEDYLRESTVL